MVVATMCGVMSACLQMVKAKWRHPWAGRINYGADGAVATAPIGAQIQIKNKQTYYFEIFDYCNHVHQKGR